MFLAAVASCTLAFCVSFFLFPFYLKNRKKLRPEF